ncbi:MAG: SAM-dependent methyltransferase [Acidobacteria bacterium]|nr:SAM-dependent methyltransferase [Acidobacteriota bacterium]
MDRGLFLPGKYLIDLYMANLLFEKIQEEIAESGPLPFSRYMELCLYHPELGYYNRGNAQFGKAGDFYTSSDVEGILGRLLARQFDEIWRLGGSPNEIQVLELGPGRGFLAKDVLDWCEKKFPVFFAALDYRLVERSPELGKQLRRNLARHFESGRCSFLKSSLLDPDRQLPGRLSTDAPGKRQFSGRTLQIILANEFFDSLPFEVLGENGQLRIGLENGQLVEIWDSPTAEALDYIDRYSVRPEAGERIEAPLVAQNYASACAQLIECGFFIAIDYGYTRDEVFAGRYRGTLMTYRQHATSADPYQAPGEQDITAHVNFTAIAAALQRSGMHPQKLVTQSEFLMGIGESTEFRDAFQDCRLPEDHRKASLRLKLLVTPAGLGETFQVQVATKRVSLDAVSRLSGLKFR